jgi:hypothetical protein
MGKSFSYNVETVTFRGAILAVIFVKKARLCVQGSSGGTDCDRSILRRWLSVATEEMLKEVNQ